MADEVPHRTGTQAIERALAVLGALETGPDTLSLTELSERTGLSPSTTHRLIRVLCDGELLRKDARSERYGLGHRLITLGVQATKAFGLSSARPLLEQLSADTGESVNLGVRDGNEVLVLMCIPSSQGLRFDQQAGCRVPLYASAMGKALLAFDPDADEVLRSLPRLVKLTDSTLTSRDALRVALDKVRRYGWALNDEERVAGVRTVAAAVRNPDGTARAAIAVQGPAVRMTEARITTIARQVQRTGAEVARHLVVAPPER